MTDNLIEDLQDAASVAGYSHSKLLGRAIERLQALEEVKACIDIDQLISKLLDWAYIVNHSTDKVAIVFSDGQIFREAAIALRCLSASS